MTRQPKTMVQHRNLTCSDKECIQLLLVSKRIIGLLCFIKIINSAPKFLRWSPAPCPMSETAYPLSSQNKRNKSTSY